MPAGLVHTPEARSPRSQYASDRVHQMCVLVRACSDTTSSCFHLLLLHATAPPASLLAGRDSLFLFAYRESYSPALLPSPSPKPSPLRSLLDPAADIRKSCRGRSYCLCTSRLRPSQSHRWFAQFLPPLP